MKYKTKENLTLASLVGITGLAGILLTLPTVSAETEAVDTVTITVPSACSMTPTVGTTHTTSVDSGTYVDDIGTTTLKTTCNDSNGFSIYAIGYTNDEYGNTVLKSSLGDTSNVITGTATSGNTSNWAMKLEAGSGTYAPTIETDTNGSFANYHVIPDSYTKVATFASTTDATNGSTLTTTYAVFMNATQPAGTYEGKVKYTLVHPANEEPLQPQVTASGKIHYYANASNAVGTMGEQNISDYPAKDWSQCTFETNYSTTCKTSYSNSINISDLPDTDYSTITLLASNYSRAGYGFAGWSDKFDYATNNSAKFYGPMETITLNTSDYSGTNNGLSLYAVWVKSAGSLQDSEKVAELCGTGNSALDTAPTNGTANLSSVSALTDSRDNQTYAIAKFADGNCWMIENLRLESTNSDNSTGSLAQGYNSSFKGLATAESEHFSDSDTTANSLYTTESNIDGKNTISGSYQAYRFPRYNNTNTSTRASSPTANSGSMYSYGNYYTWHAAIADTTHYSSGDHDTTSICPSGWKLPLGNTSTGDIEQGASDSANRVGGFSYLDRKMGGIGAYQSTAADSLRWRKFPLNFLYSGFFSTSSAYNRGSSGSYWSSTASDYSYSYRLYLSSSEVDPGTGRSRKCYGNSIRCLAI